MIRYTLMLWCLLSSIVAQQLDNHQYLHIPDTYTNMKYDASELNAMTKGFFEGKKIPVLMGDVSNWPLDAKTNGCSVARFDVREENNFTRTKLFVTVKDCNGKALLEGYGDSKEKNRRKSYRYALLKALKQMNGLQYNHIPTQQSKIPPPPPPTMKKQKDQPIVRDVPPPPPVNKKKTIEDENISSKKIRRIPPPPAIKKLQNQSASTKKEVKWQWKADPKVLCKSTNEYEIHCKKAQPTSQKGWYIVEFEVGKPQLLQVVGNKIYLDSTDNEGEIKREEILK